MSAERPDQAQEAQEAPLDPLVTPELFREWRSPRFCLSNPERMNNPVWEWLIRSKLSAYQATERFLDPSALDAGPGWCFDRFGQSSTQLPHEEVPKAEEEYNVFRIKIEGIVVRYIADMHSIQMTAEGDLPQGSVQALASDLAGKMSALENTPYESKQL